MDRLNSAESAAALLVHSERAASRPPSKLLGIEIVRFTSALAILLWHYQHFAFVSNVPVDFVRDRQPFYGLLESFYNYGFLAVEVFWCTSGFIFFYKYRQSVSAQKIDGRKFFLLRFSRLYPLHFATLLLVALMQPIYRHLHGYYFVYQDNDLKHFVSQLLFASAWGFVGSESFNEPIWSVSLEVIVYFIFFIVLRYVGKALGIHFTVLATSGIMMIGILLIAPNASFFLVCLFLFYLGGLVAIGSQNCSQRARRVAGGLALLALLATPFFGRIFAPLGALYVLGSLLMISLPALLYCAAAVSFKSRWVQKMVEGAGNLTYSSYLLQFPIQLAIATGFSLLRRPIPLYDARFWLAYFTVTLVASFLVYRYFESPMQRSIRARFGLASQRPAKSQSLG